MSRSTEDLEQILTRWRDNVSQYRQSFRRDADFIVRAPADDSPIVVALGTTLREMFLTMASGVTRHDQWLSYRDIRPLLNGHSVVFRAKKLEEDYELGYDGRGFFLSTQFQHPEHLRRMDDSFWYELLSLWNLGSVEYQPNIPVGTETGAAAEKKLKSKSETFRIIRDVVLLESQEYDSICDLGGLDVRWTPDVDIGELIVRGDHALRILYDVNYRLWRTEYQLRRERQQSKATKRR